MTTLQLIISPWSEHRHAVFNRAGGLPRPFARVR
jgi:hypothetical protein